MSFNLSMKNTSRSYWEKKETKSLSSNKILISITLLRKQPNSTALAFLSITMKGLFLFVIYEQVCPPSSPLQHVWLSSDMTWKGLLHARICFHNMLDNLHLHSICDGWKIPLRMTNQGYPYGGLSSTFIANTESPRFYPMLLGIGELTYFGLSNVPIFFGHLGQKTNRSVQNILAHCWVQNMLVPLVLIQNVWGCILYGYAFLSKSY